MLTSKQIMDFTVKAIDSKKGKDVKVLFIRDISTVADYFVICSGNSGIHMRAVADEIDEKLSELNINPRGREGVNNDFWILLDYSDVIVHIFNKESRDFYSIENLWADASEVDISNLISED